MNRAKRLLAALTLTLGLISGLLVTAAPPAAATTAAAAVLTSLASIYAPEISLRFLWGGAWRVSSGEPEAEPAPVPPGDGDVEFSVAGLE